MVIILARHPESFEAFRAYKPFFVHTTFGVLFTLFDIFFQLSHTMDDHSQYLLEVCRIGGKKFSSCSPSTSYCVERFSTEISTVFKIDVSKDDPLIHPSLICSMCERTLLRAKNGADFSKGGCASAVNWAPHHRTECKFCINHTSPKPRGRPSQAATGAKKTQLRGKAAQWNEHAQSPTDTTTCMSLSSASQITNSLDNIVSIEEVHKRACKSYKANVDITEERFIDVNVAVICQLCENAADNIIQAACCDELYCCGCISSQLLITNVCPSCGAEMQAPSLKHPDKALSKLLSSRSIRCDFYAPSLCGCPAVVPLHTLKQHVDTCSFNPTTPGIPIRAVRPSSTVSEITTASPSKLQGDVARSLTGSMVVAQACKKRLEVRTGANRKGHPLVFHQIPCSIVPSTEASASTLKRRAVELTRIAEEVCGGSDGARIQVIAGLKRLSADAQDNLLREAGIRCATPAQGTALAIKADLRLPWTQLRKLRQWLKILGVKLESEHTMRGFIAEKLPSYTAMEMPMSKKSGTVSMAATIFFPDLVAVIMHYLDLLAESDRLTWHNGVIPQSEIWIKLGGDHGGGNFKFSFQVANVSSPNATNNTVPVCIFNEKDTPANLETALGQYRSQIEELQNASWRGKAIQVFLFGDYEYQTVNYGLSGSGGVRPCLHCLCRKKDMVDNAEENQPRTLATLADDHEKFVAAGSQLSNAKHFNNVIRPCILPVALTNVIIPVLHLDLGIFTWMFDSLLKELRRLDLLLAAKANAADTDGERFAHLCNLHRDLCVEEQEVAKASTQVNMVCQQLEFAALHIQQQAGTPDVLALLENLQQLYQVAVANHRHHTTRQEQLTNEIARVTAEKNFMGPCVASVEPVLQQHGIERQAYHGGAFIGNHVHRALKPTVVPAISYCHVPVVEERCPELVGEARQVGQRYARLMASYATCTAVFSSCKALDDLAIDQLQQDINVFLLQCRQEIVARGLGHVTPKLHLLELHIIPLIRKFRVGLGLLAEQGAESLHSSLNTLDALFKNIPGDLARLKTVAEQHLLTTTKEAVTLRPQSRKRKSEEQ